MTLRAISRKRLNVDLEECLECLLDPCRFFGGSRYTGETRCKGDDHEIVFVWRKFGMTKKYRVNLKVYRSDNEIIYLDRNGKMRCIISLKPTEEGVDITVKAEMEAGLMADLFGRGEFKTFIDNLVSRGIAALVRKRYEHMITAEKEAGASCARCIFFEREANTCLLTMKPVRDPDEPECHGEKFLDAERVKAAVSA